MGKPLVMEKLDFSRRKQELASTKDKLDQARQSRALSSFAYSGIVQALQSNALLMQVPSIEVNPAYTSVIGRVKYAKPLGVSVHQAAAKAIALRGIGFGEAAPRRSPRPRWPSPSWTPGGARFEACGACGAHHHRDVNSALVIRARGLAWLEKEFSTAGEARAEEPVVNERGPSGLCAVGHDRPVVGIPVL
ncbi:hypothetical protein [Hydrogenophaga sp. BPS33]|uniref:hypothetical protein n=1 Tax=Hydrogenophaga sp. BPS33 TaxID=2651974 RepID=UPI00131F6FBF|nr:hypothetical protein [Hydrogenophaga sp. BPS33]QHE87191.1 hypothetical protein F9K07_20950 [Hydrogenophaga sp. BPS33]